MESYFIRHTPKLAVVDEAIDHLWQQDMIAIHFPEVHYRSSVTPREVEDETSLDETRYGKRGARQAVRIFQILNTHGGYVWAEYRGRNEAKAGVVVPNSFALYETRWRPGTFPYDRTAKLKTLRLDMVRKIGPGREMALRAARPRQGTVAKWHVEDRLADVVEGRPVQKSWPRLSTEQQEAACAEYLRDPDSAQCPRLEHLLLPVGRTLRDVDIFGYASDGRLLYVQVTFGGKEESHLKIERLKRYRDYGNSDAHLILFCDCEKVHSDDGILLIPWKRVETWISINPDYQTRLFSG